MNFNIRKRLFSFYKVFFNNYFKSFQGPFFGFVLPVMLMFIFYFLGIGKQGPTPEIQTAANNDMIKNYLLLPPLTIGLVGLAGTIVEWKESIFLKRIEATPVKKSQFLISVITFFSLVSLAGFVIVLIFSVFALLIQGAADSVGSQYVKDVFSQVNWGYLIIAVVLLILLSISMGVFLGGVVSSGGMAQALGLLIFFPSAFLGGIILPPEVLDTSSAIRIISYFIPHKYVAFANLIAWHDGKIPPVPSGYHYKEFTAVWQPFVFSSLLILGFGGLTVPTFKLTSNNR